MTPTEIVLAAAFDAAPDALLIVKQDGQIWRANEAARELFGYGVEEMRTLTVDALVPPAHRAAHAAHRAGYRRRPTRRVMAERRGLEGIRKDGRVFPAHVSLSPLECDGDQWTIVAIRDVTVEVERERELREMGMVDEMTGLFNRRFFEAELDRLSQGREPVGVILADLDDLKVVNDTLGHAAGDTLLKTFAALLRAHVRASDIVARLGGDEFGLLLPDATPASLAALHGRLEQALRGDCLDDVDESDWACARSTGCVRGDRKLAASFGSAWASPPARLRDAVREADGAMYDVKRDRKSRAPT
jgi:diguanylate cyclase (GGDEF)-like protein/PAS domain S-box-containing protein